MLPGTKLNCASLQECIYDLPVNSRNPSLALSPEMLYDFIHTRGGIAACNAVGPAEPVQVGETGSAHYEVGRKESSLRSERYCRQMMAG